MTVTSPQIGPPLTAAPVMPAIGRSAALTRLAVFPAITLVQFVASPYLGGWPQVARTFVVTRVAVPLSVYVLVPRLMRLTGGVHRRPR